MRTYKETREDTYRLRLDEYNDCTVISLSIAGDISYEAAHCAISELGRKVRGRGIWGCQKKACDMLDIGWNVIWKSHYNDCIVRVKDAPAMFPNGNYIIEVRGHVVAMVDGIVEDWTAGRMHHINRIIAITPLEVVEVEPLEMPSLAYIALDATLAMLKDSKSADDAEIYNIATSPVYGGVWGGGNGSSDGCVTSHVSPAQATSGDMHTLSELSANAWQALEANQAYNVVELARWSRKGRGGTYDAEKAASAKRALFAKSMGMRPTEKRDSHNNSTYEARKAKRLAKLRALHGDRS